METFIADISEFQKNIDADAYIKGGHPILICRVHNGYRADQLIAQRLPYLRSKNFTALGFYQYVVHDRDPVRQAQEFVATIGKLRPNEFPIQDLEEGGGNQVPRAVGWFSVVDPWAGFQSTLYSGEAFLDDQLGGTQRWGQRPLWIASYLNSFEPAPEGQPADATFWQYTNRGRFPGLAGRVDGSIYRGSPQQFASRIGLKAAAPISVGKSSISVVLPGGRIETFVEMEDGTVLHIWQTATNSDVWSGWQTLGRPG